MIQGIRQTLLSLRAGIRGTFAYVQHSPITVHDSVIRMMKKTKAKALDATPKKLRSLIEQKHARVWVDGRKAFRRIHTLIERAESSIVIRMFIWKNDSTGRKLRDALLKAANRGVQISITKEASGDFFETHQSFLDTRDSHDKQWKQFWDHDNIFVDYRAIRDHSKVFIIDQSIVLLTGMNVAEEYEYRWHDYLIELCGVTFVREVMEYTTSRRNRGKARLIVNREHQMDVRPHVTQMLKNARRSITIEQCYFHDPAITEELIKKSKEGIRITIIIPKHADIGHHGNLETVDQLLKNGERNNIRVLMYPTMFHAKLIIVDSQTAFTGSANLNTLSLDRTGEVCVELRGRSSALRRLRRSVRKNIRKSNLLHAKSSSRKNKLLAMIGL